MPVFGVILAMVTAAAVASLVGIVVKEAFSGTFTPKFDWTEHVFDVRQSSQMTFARMMCIVGKLGATLRTKKTKRRFIHTMFKTGDTTEIKLLMPLEWTTLGSGVWKYVQVKYTPNLYGTNQIAVRWRKKADSEINKLIALIMGSEEYDASVVRGFIERGVGIQEL